MKFDYKPVTQALRQEAQAQSKVQPLRSDRCQSLFFFHSKPTPKAFLLFHGFTAGPYQLQSVGKTLFEAGYNVVIPLLPGHGLVGLWNQKTPPPLPLHQRIYEEFALRWFKRSRVLGKHIGIGGLGTGATLATWLGSKYPQVINRLALVDPYFPPIHQASPYADPLLPYNLVTEALMDQAGDRFWRWIVPRQAEPPLGYEGFSPRTIQVWLDLAQGVYKRTQTVALPPTLVVGSERERAVGDETSRLFCEHIRQFQPQSWHLYCRAVLDLNHVLLNPSSLEEQSRNLCHLLKQYAHLDLETATAIPLAS